MEARVRSAGKKVTTTTNSLKSSLEKKNHRLVQKYVVQLRENVEELDKVCIEAEMAEVNPTEGYLLNFIQVSDTANELLITGDEYLLSVEETEEASALKKVNSAKILELSSLLTSFGRCLAVPVEDLDAAGMGKLINKRQKQMKDYEEQKIKILSDMQGDQLSSFQDLEKLYRSTALVLDEWVESSLKSTGNPKVTELKPEGENKKAPSLKLDRLTLPIFSGNIRSYARFLREFNATVATEFTDPKIKLLYLQNQCLAGPAKECVKNLTKYDDVMNRLNERYGKVRNVVDVVLKDINQARLPEDEVSRTIALAGLLETAWDDITAINALDEFCNIITLGTIESKLPPRLQISWAQEKEGSSKTCMEKLKVFIERQRSISEEVLMMRTTGLTTYQRHQFRNRDPREKVNVSATNIVEPKKKACFRCGFIGHFAKECKVPSSIKCRKCQKVGHIENACKLKDMKVPVEKAEETNSNNINTSSHVCSIDFDTKSAVRLPIENIMTTHGPCLTLWDSGSMINLVSKQWAIENGLSGKSCSLEYQVVDGAPRKFITSVYNIELISKNGLKKTVKAYEIESLAANISLLEHEVIEKVIASVDAQIEFESILNASGKVKLLLGGELINHFPIVKHHIGDMCLMSSDFGLNEFFIVGSQKGSWRSSDVHVICNVVDKFLTDFFSVEEIGVRPPPLCKVCKSCEICKPAAQFMTLKEHMELSVIKSKLKYNPKGQRWTAAYPYCKDPAVLKDNYQFACKVLKRRENKLMKDKILLRLYSEQILDFVKRGVLKKMSEDELLGWTGPVRYVDHHEVYKESSTTPVRIVINSSFKEGNELSLNDILMKGPNVLSSLFDVLVRWRLYPVAFAGDISKMYHNVDTEPLEANLRRLLWRDCKQDQPPDVYCFQTVTFGDRPAGCIVVSALRATADMYTYISERAAEVIKADSYMDDVVSGEFTIDAAKILVSYIEKIAEKGGFKFKKFVFSCEYQEDGKRLPAEKILGVHWEPSEDLIKFEIDLNHNKKRRGRRAEPVDLEDIPYSRRVCLRLVNSIFDPLGLVSPVTVKLKILMKQHFVVMQKYKKWDSLLHREDKNEWIQLLKDILKLKQMQIPRFCLRVSWTNAREDGRYTLICFTDASSNAMCAAVYIRFETISGVVNSGLLVSKTRVSPVKPETIPKLELCATLLGARLVRKVTAALSFDIDAEYFLIDSKIVLGALSKGSLASDFSGNCIAEIRGKTKSGIFGWVRSEDNIADIGSRGANPGKVHEETEWQRGPSWLIDPISTWPVEIVCLEELPVVGNVQLNDEVISIEKYSDIHRLHKHTALCLKFAKSRGNGKGKIDCDWKKIKLTPEDYLNAEKYWIKKVSEHVVVLYNSQKLQSLRPSLVWEDNGQFTKVVTSGRLGTLLKIGYDVEELTILDQSHPYTNLVMKGYHDMDHASDDKAVWKSRTKFWIPSARRIVRKIRKSCYRCRLLNRRNAQQMMAPLPDTRVLPTPAWTFTSLDLFGPLEHSDMVRKRLKEKCWGVLFTCRVSRAVHLDLTQGYDTDSLLQAIRRFMSLRGAPREFLADQGSQIIACSKEIAGVLELIDWNVVEGWCAKRTIEWKFVPPQAQHMNGVTESLIRSTKTILKQTLEGKRLTYAETQTVLYEAAQVMNCRPLGLYSRPGSDPLDGGPITPNHLLLGRATTNIPEQKFTNVSITKRIKFLQSCQQEFWVKWKAVVFHSLVPQYKWHKSQRNVQIKDIVLVNDDSGLVGEYKLGQIHSIKIGKDGLVRSAQVRCVCSKDGKISKGIIERPIHKLCIIVPIEEQ